MTASQMRIAETIDAFYGDAGANDGVSRSYKQAVEDLDAETIKALDGPYRYNHIYYDLRFPPQNERRERFSHRLIQYPLFPADKPCLTRSVAFAPTSPISTNVWAFFFFFYISPFTCFNFCLYLFSTYLSCPFSHEKTDFPYLFFFSIKNFPLFNACPQV